MGTHPIFESDFDCLTEKMSKNFERLPKNVKPINYDIFIKANFETFKFNGRVTYNVEVLQPTKIVKMNCADIEIQNAKVQGQDAKHEFDVEQEEVSLIVENEIPVGPASITIEYTGTHNDKMKGFYRTKHVNEDGSSFYSLVTQFESTDARRALPCWDEPACKATFDVKLNVPGGKTALSNMNQTNEEKLSDGTVTYTYARSPIMSSYLLAFAVGDYDYVEASTKNGVLVRVYTDKGCSSQGQFALETGVKSLEYYEEYFNIKYPLPKCDMIAIPDFQAGAMENWGLVTYRSTCILFDAEKSPVTTKQRVAIVVCHELAHQWFGNLVTMEWWTHLWLNEGFASFMEYLCTDAIFPEWRIWEQFVSHDMFGAMNLDALDSSHPIEVEVGHPSEVDEIFDQISYSKGASVIRMLHDFIGRDAFKTGMQHYLTTYSYKNTSTEDLWASLETASGKPVGKVMTTWTSQMGFPIVHVDSMTDGDGKTVLTLNQEKFNADGSASEAGYMWCIPIKILDDTGKVTEILMETKETIVTLENIKWFKLNPDFVGYYRVHYQNQKDLDGLRNAIENKVLSEVDRLGLIDDTFALVQAGKANTDDALELIKACKNETSYVVWSCIIKCLGCLRTILAHDEDLDDKYKAFAISLMGNITEQVGWNANAEESHVTSLLRAKVLSVMGAYGHAATVMEAKKRFADHFNDKAQIPADLRGSVYRTVAAHGGQ